MLGVFRYWDFASFAKGGQSDSSLSYLWRTRPSADEVSYCVDSHYFDPLWVIWQNLVHTLPETSETNSSLHLNMNIYVYIIIYTSFLFRKPMRFQIAELTFLPTNLLPGMIFFFGHASKLISGSGTPRWFKPSSQIWKVKTCEKTPTTETLQGMDHISHQTGSWEHHLQICHFWGIC